MFSRSKLSAVILSSALGLASAHATAQDAQKTLRLVPQSDLKILDPIWTTAAITRDYGYNVYDTLFGVDATGKVLPEMVDKYTNSADNKTWTFTLRKGLKFSDGAPVTSQDVIASLKRWGSRDVIGQVMLTLMDKMEATDANSFKMTFKEPFGIVLEALAKPSSLPAFIMPARVAQTSPNDQISDNTGSGPYMLKKDEYRPGERVVFVKNPHYVPRNEPPSGTAGGKNVYVDRLEWVILKDAQTQANALANGEVDMIASVPSEQYAALKANPKITVDENVQPRTTVTMQFNHIIPPFDNPKIAQAALLAVNQEALMRGAMRNKELYATCLSIYPCTTQYASSDSLYFTGKAQFEKAKALLKEAGYDGKPIVLMYQTDHPVLNKFPPVMAQLLKQAGFNVDLQATDWQTLLMRRAKRNPVGDGGWNAFITSWAGVENINPLFFPALSGNGVRGWFGWATDPKLEEMKAEFLATSDATKHKEIAVAIQKRVFETGMFAPLGEYKPSVAYRKGIVSGTVKGPVGVFWNLKKN